MDTEREMLGQKMGDFYLDCLVTWVDLLLVEAGISDRIPGHCWVSSLALPQAHHVGRTKFHIY